MLKIAVLLQRAWPHLLSVIGGLGLALSPLYLEWLRDWGEERGHGDMPAIVVLIILSLLSLAGVLWGVARYERRIRTVQADVMTALRASFVPVVDRFLALPDNASASTIEDVMTEVVARVALFAKKDDDSPDANIYRLRRDRLARINRSGGTARDAFKISNGTSAEAVESNKVVERVIAAETTICEDVRSRRIRKKLSLAKIDRSYRSFVSVPILLRNGEVYGMISLNSSKRNGLQVTHLLFLENVAKLIGKLDAVNRGPDPTSRRGTRHNG